MTAEPGSRVGYGLPRSARVLATREFKRIYSQGNRARGRLMTVVVRARPGLPVLRLGLSVSKDHGPAVRRNKIKRILREAFRLERPGLPVGFDVVVIPVVLERKLVLGEAREELVRLVQSATGPRAERRRR